MKRLPCIILVSKYGVLEEPEWNVNLELDWGKEEEVFGVRRTRVECK